jgi:hypothetical protein
MRVVSVGAVTSAGMVGAFPDATLAGATALGRNTGGSQLTFATAGCAPASQLTDARTFTRSFPNDGQDIRTGIVRCPAGQRAVVAVAPSWTSTALPPHRSRSCRTPRPGGDGREGEGTITSSAASPNNSGWNVTGRPVVADGTRLVSFAVCRPS